MTTQQQDTMMTDDTKTAAAAAGVAASNTTIQQRDSLNGGWILDKSKSDWSMRGYLETLNVDHLAIEAHEKGDLEHDTIHTIVIPDDRSTIQITKRSRVNNDLVVVLNIGQEHIEYLKPDDRPKRMIATSEDNLQTHLKIQSSLLTMNGMTAHVTDIKRLIQQPQNSSTSTILVQELTIMNEQTKATKTTIRHFLPYDTPTPTPTTAPTKMDVG